MTISASFDDRPLNTIGTLVPLDLKINNYMSNYLLCHISIKIYYKFFPHVFFFIKLNFQYYNFLIYFKSKQTFKNKKLQKSLGIKI